MSKDKTIDEAVEDGNVIVVNTTQELPYLYIPYSSVAVARTTLRQKQADGLNLDPDATLYVFDGKLPGFRIVAYPIMMTDPDKEETHVEKVAALV